MEGLNGQLWQNLQEVINTYGADIFEDPGRLEGLLKDQCGQYKREIRLLISTLKEGVVNDLRLGKGSTPVELLVPQLCKKIEENLLLSPEAAEWAVKSWAVALGLLPSLPINLTARKDLDNIPHSIDYTSSPPPLSQKIENINKAVKKNKSRPYDGMPLNPNIAKPVSKKVNRISIIIISIIFIIIALSITAALWYVYIRFGSNWWLLLCIPISIMGVWCVTLWIQRIIQESKN